jgi:two-component system sensor histidine kinase KdpD
MSDRLPTQRPDPDKVPPRTQTENGPADVRPPGVGPRSARTPWSAPRRPYSLWQRYGLAILLVGLGGLLSEVMHRFLAPTNLVMIYLLVVMLAALYLGRGPAVVAAVLSVLVFDFFFVPPYLTLAVSQVEYLFTFLALLVVGLLISGLTARVQEQLEATRLRERETAALYTLSRDLAVAADLDSVAQAVTENASETFGREVAVLLPGANGEQSLRLCAPRFGTALDEQELAVATWVFEQGQPAGRGTDFHPGAALRYLPLSTARGLVGVLGVRPAETGRYMTAGQRRLLEAFASVTAVAVERVRLAEAEGQLQLLEATDKLQSALLHSISHDLRTPLVSITGALTTLQEEDMGLDDEARTVLIDTAAEEAGRLNRLVGNLLDMTRLEAGAIKVKREPRDVQDAIGAALQQVAERLGNRPVEIDVPPDLPLVSMDSVLIVHALVNLIENALKYSPPDSPIRICTRVSDGEIAIEVADRGIGIPEEDLARVFEKFFRVQRPDSVTGTGLGLSISKGLVEAHGGRIAAQNRPGGGSIITIALPLSEAEAQETP